MEHRFFSYDAPSGDFQTHATAEEAKACAEEALDCYRDEACEGWEAGVTEICWGELKQTVVETMRKERPATLDEDGYDEDGICWPQEWDSMIDYGMVDVTQKGGAA